MDPMQVYWDMIASAIGNMSDDNLYRLRTACEDEIARRILESLEFPEE